jgi:hypothetical protein
MSLCDGRCNRVQDLRPVLRAMIDAMSYLPLPRRLACRHLDTTT